MTTRYVVDLMRNPDNSVRVNIVWMGDLAANPQGYPLQVNGANYPIMELAAESISTTIAAKEVFSDEETILKETQEKVAAFEKQMIDNMKEQPRIITRKTY